MEPALQAGLAGDAKTLQGDVGGILELRERQQRIAVDHGQLQQGRAVSCGPSQSPSSVEAGEPLVYLPTEEGVACDAGQDAENQGRCPGCFGDLQRPLAASALPLVREMLVTGLSCTTSPRARLATEEVALSFASPGVTRQEC
jgi:hypothetical protein